jgi:hypothetical protein
MKTISIIFTVFVTILLLNSIPVNAAPILGDTNQDGVIILARGGFGGFGPGDGTGNDGLGPRDGTGYGPGEFTSDGGARSGYGTEEGHHGQSEDQGRSGNSYGPGDGTGNDGIGPREGTGYGPGDCTVDEEAEDLA